LPYYITELVKPKVPHAVEKMGITKIIRDYWWLVRWLSEDWWIKQKNKKTKNISSDNLLKKSSVISLQIITWRTHQIRYHLSQKWLPIVWDYLYWKESKTSMQLTAYKLDFVDMEGEKVSLEV